MISVKYLEKNLPAYISESSGAENCMRDSHSNLYVIPCGLAGEYYSINELDLIRFKAKFINLHSNSSWVNLIKNSSDSLVLPSSADKNIYIIATYSNEVKIKFNYAKEIKLKNLRWIDAGIPHGLPKPYLSLSITEADVYNLFKNKSDDYVALSLVKCKLMSDLNETIKDNFFLNNTDLNGHSIIVDVTECGGQINFKNIDSLDTDLIEIKSSTNINKSYFYIINEEKLQDLDTTTSKQFYWDKQLYIARIHALENVKVRFDKYIVTAEKEIQAKNSLITIDNLEINETPLSKSKLEGALIKIKNLIINNGEENFDMFTDSFKIEIENIISTKPFINLCPNGTSNSIIYKGKTYNRKGKVIL